MPILLQTARFSLRAIAKQDVDALVALDADPAVMRHLTGGIPTPREDYMGDDGFLARMLSFSDSPIGFWAAEMDGHFMGWFHLRPSVADDTILEIGYRLRRAFWGKGLATEGSRALAELNFGYLGHQQLHAVTVAENHASLRVMEKLGMTYRGQLMHPRGGGEVVLYACDHEQYLQSLS